MNAQIITNLIEEKWDYLIVLDACRYDYFMKMWKAYLPHTGHLSCRKSAGSCTNEWRDNLFPGYYEDVVYITANPQINLSMPVFGYCAKDHFKYVHEVWKDGWNKQYGTVLPETMTRKALDIIPHYEKNKKFIIHYIQPHAPYINTDSYIKEFSLEQFIQAQTAVSNNKINNRVKRFLYNRLLPLFRNRGIRTNQPEWLLRKFLRIPPILPMETAWRELGSKGLKEAYKTNLKAVLYHVSVLINSLAGTIVVTSDHGELLGEDGCFGHPFGSDNPILRTIPWYTLTKTEKLSKPRDLLSTSSPTSPPKDSFSQETKEEQEQAVIDRLRALGYHE